MTQEEKWKKNYAEVVEYMDTYHRNPSKHRVEDHLLLNWMKHQRKLMNRGELKPERVAAFKRLLAKSESLKRVNQWEVAVEEIMKNDDLRNYQQEMIDRLEVAWKQYRSVMLQMPTGTGKTVLMAEVIRRKKSGGILIVAHRRELLDQIRGTVKYFGIDMEKNHVVVESIQKLSRILGHTESTESTERFSNTNCSNYTNTDNKRHTESTERFSTTNCSNHTNTDNKRHTESTERFSNTNCSNYTNTERFSTTNCSNYTNTDNKRHTESTDNTERFSTTNCSNYTNTDNKRHTESTESTERFSTTNCSNYTNTDNKRHTESTESTERFSNTNCSNYTNFEPTLVIIDEAHHALAKTYRMLWERWPKAKFLGLTATPCRLNNEGFLDLFQTLVQSHTIQEFIQMGWLSDFDYVTAEPDNPILKQVGSLKKRGVDGDYQTKEMALVMDCEESIENLYQAYRKYVNGKKGIVYAIDREHARHITEYYQRQGVNCCWIEAKTPTAERDRLVQEYRDGLIDVVVNVDILSEGADFPEVEFIQLARPTLSLSKYLQQVGRGMRIAEGKDKVVILDHVGMYQSFGLPTEDWNWPLMFTGQMAGKAGMGRECLLYVRGDGYEKELINTHMVNIKRKDEAHRGLEIFMKDGLYGIAKDGRMIHQPLFERIRRADDGYFAYCTYPYLVWKSRSTIIDQDGRDLGLRMYGNLEWVEASLLKGQDIKGEELYWDRRYNQYYHEKPMFVRIGGIEMTKLRAGYVLRKYPTLIKPASKRKIYYNSHIIWMGDWLISKYDAAAEGDYRPQRILSYGYKSFYVKTATTDQPDVTIIDKEGHLIGRCWAVPERDDHKFPDWQQTPLTNAETGKVGFP